MGVGLVAVIGVVSLGVPTAAATGPDMAAATAPAVWPTSTGFVEGQAGSTTTFLETFDGKPSNPEPWNQRDWDVFQTSRDRISWANPDPVNAHHAFGNCGDVAAGGSHTIRTWPETVFKCNDHVMTSINGTPGYAAIYLSPPAMADFTNGSSAVSFDVSTFISSSRDWLDVLITPFDDAMSYPFRSDLEVDGSGLPRNAIHIEQDFGGGRWEIEVIRNGAVQTLGTLTIPYSRFGGQSKVTRTPVRITVSRTSITLSYPTVSGASRTVSFAALGWTQGIVQFGHHSYTPLKDCSTCSANTWHWDNIRISPARPIYQWQATPERTGGPIYDSSARTLTLGQIAPSNAVLMFSGNCGVQVRETSSTPWRSATIVGPNDHPEHTQSYRVTIPPGISTIQFRFVTNNWYGPGLGCQLSNPIVKAQSTVAASGNPLFSWDAATGSWAVRTMSGFVFQQRSAGTWSLGYDEVIAGDFDRDGRSDDYFAWDRNTGSWVVQTLVNYAPQYRFAGRWGLGYDEIVAGDFDSDGFVNDLFVWDKQTGRWVMQSLSGFRPTYRRSGSYSPGYDTFVVGDWDGDGRFDDAFIWDTSSGYWVIHSFAGFVGYFRRSGKWSAGYERAYNGDWDRDYRRDDLLVWDDNTGSVSVFSFAAFTPTYRRSVRFSSTIDIAATADLDNDRRWNELVVFDQDARQWQVYRFVGFVPSLARAGFWPVSYDELWG